MDAKKFLLACVCALFGSYALASGINLAVAAWEYFPSDTAPYKSSLDFGQSQWCAEGTCFNAELQPLVIPRAGHAVEKSDWLDYLPLPLGAVWFLTIALMLYFGAFIVMRPIEDETEEHALPIS